MEIGAYGKNILNEKYIIDAGNSGNAIGFPTFIAGNPAVFGGQIRMGF
jgi:outer membrane receptor protein involved in Fe transport